jgi:hypothetical protein
MNTSYSDSSNADNDLDYYNYYYLLYKIKNIKSNKNYKNYQNKLWIIEESTNKVILIDRVKKIYSNHETYFIYRKFYTKDEINDKYNTKFKRFQNFKIDSDCELIFKSE